MAEIINLNKARKARAKAIAQGQAETNRARFGRSKAEKARDAAEAERKVRTLDQARRETPEDPS
ncbi:DUF4169 family protein [Sphingomonas sp. TDK1]|uniref:DUF4169 family protein n=1 Tax=Sphingomonas sp. TDK1 TaxID=453247 RepID=UPI0007DA15FB|nr:DUF4169 family protein [Sphingomonas sp. TDK1]OAN66373.1 hypothetical protein A7X12_13465 [Sphingomonas sp. TDK1]